MVNGLNVDAERLCQTVAANSDELDVVCSKTTNGTTILDFGTDRQGTMAAGIELARICMADRANVSLSTNAGVLGLEMLQVETDQPVLACIASQYAGWPFSTENLFSMCSGPARLKRGREEILHVCELTTDDQNAVGILETNQTPVAKDVAEFADECRCRTEQLTLCLARTCSLPGTIQVVARSVETAMHKLFEMGFDLNKVVRGAGNAPMPPAAKDDYIAMGWTNDAILYGGEVHLWVDELPDVDEFVTTIPSSSSEQFGRPFKDIFEEYNRDFYKVDRMLFSPAKVTVTCLASGKSATAGEIRSDLLKVSFESGD